MERQRKMTQQRLEARRRKREEQQYEEDMAASIVTMAEKQFALIREKTMMRREGQKDTVSLELLWLPQRGGGGEFHMKGAGMRVVSFWGVNYGYLSHLWCLGQSANLFSRRDLV